MLLSHFKKTLTLLLLVMAVSLVSIAQDPNAIAASLRAGNAKDIAQHFDKRVVLAIDGQSNNYSSQQGEIILKNFLSRFSTRNFTILHKGTSQGNAQYMVGNLQTNQGTFRTSIYISNQTIQEIRFEKND